MTEEETKAQKPANISRDGDVIAVRCVALSSVPG